MKISLWVRDDEEVFTRYKPQMQTERNGLTWFVDSRLFAPPKRKLKDLNGLADALHEVAPDQNTLKKSLAREMLIQFIPKRQGLTEVQSFQEF